MMYQTTNQTTCLILCLSLSPYTITIHKSSQNPYALLSMNYKWGPDTMPSQFLSSYHDAVFSDFPGFRPKHITTDPTLCQRRCSTVLPMMECVVRDKPMAPSLMPSRYSIRVPSDLMNHKSNVLPSDKPISAPYVLINNVHWWNPYTVASTAPRCGPNTVPSKYVNRLSDTGLSMYPSTPTRWRQVISLPADSSQCQLRRTAVTSMECQMRCPLVEPKNCHVWWQGNIRV